MLSMSDNDTAFDCKWWVGIRLDGSGRDVFDASNAPTRETHGHLYKLCIGPHKSKEAAEYMAGPGYANPNCNSPNDAEKIVSNKLKVVV